jgi:hypothetical protein
LSSCKPPDPLRFDLLREGRVRYGRILVPPHSSFCLHHPRLTSKLNTLPKMKSSVSSLISRNPCAVC